MTGTLKIYGTLPDVWVIVRGSYEDAVVVGVVSSREKAAALESSTKHLSGTGLDTITAYGPFPVGTVLSRDEESDMTHDVSGAQATTTKQGG